MKTIAQNNSIKKLSVFSLMLFGAAFLISANNAGAAGSAQLGEITQDTAERARSTVAEGVFYDSTGINNIMAGNTTDDICYNLDGVQTQLPPGYTMVHPGYCRRPCSPVSGTVRQVLDCVGYGHSRTGYQVLDREYTLKCTGPYGTRSIYTPAAFAMYTQQNCVYKQYQGNDFMSSFEHRVTPSGTNFNFGFKFAFIDNTPSKYVSPTAPSTGTTVPGPGDTRFTYFTAYKSCNNPYRIREIIVNSATGTQPDSVLGTTVNDTWYKGTVSDSNCTKVNFISNMSIGEGRNQTSSIYGIPNNSERTTRFSLRGLNQSKKAVSQAANGFQITLYNISGEELIFCFGKEVAGSPGVYSHYSACANRTLHTDKEVYAYTTGYTEPGLPTPPAEIPAPTPEPYDPYESPEMFAP